MKNRNLICIDHTFKKNELKSPVLQGFLLQIVRMQIVQFSIL